MLQLLEERFPWLGKTTDEQISGADTVDQLTDLHRELKSGRRTNRRNGRKSGN
jgi:transcriptional accessory protein Tex/SPT6